MGTVYRFKKMMENQKRQKIFHQDDEIDSRVVECGSVRSVEY